MAEEEQPAAGYVEDFTVPDTEPDPAVEQNNMARGLAAVLGSFHGRVSALPDAKWAVQALDVPAGPVAKEAAAAIAAHVQGAYGDRAALLRVVEAITGLHRPSVLPCPDGEHKGRLYCVHCTWHTSDGAAMYTPWPCPTALSVLVGLGLVAPPEKAT